MRNNRHIDLTYLQQLLFILVILLVMNSCRKSNPLDCFNSTGPDITQDRTSGTFNKIVLYNNVNLVITQDSVNSIKMVAGENIIDRVTTSVNKGTLVIENTNTCNWTRNFNREIIAYVKVKNLSGIDYRGSGDISSTNTITSDSLVLNIWEGAGKVDLNIKTQRNYIYFHIGTADVYYSGHTHLSYITAASFGPIDARNLSSVYTFMANKGSNNCFVNASLHLGATISSIGNVYYLGDPDISLSDTGDGELIKME